MDTDPNFFKRADAHITLSNDQIGEVTPNQVRASMMYATARFSAWISATDFESGAAMAGVRAQRLDHLAAEYRKMLEEHVDDYILNFEKYMTAKEGDA